MDNENNYRTGEVTQLRRIADALEEILRLVKLDQEATKKRFYDEVVKAENNDEQTSRASNGPSLPAACALVRGSGTELQATSHKLQASGCKLDKIKL